MNVHYVDDDDADLTLMLETASKIPNLKMFTSKSIAGLFDRLLTDRVDCVLLDINRPDALSLESDIECISEKWNLPVVLITGGDADDVRLRATLAGADGVIEKAAFSHELLNQVLKNARARTVAKSAVGAAEPLPIEGPSTDPAGDSEIEWLENLYQQLEAIEASLNPQRDSRSLARILDVKASLSAARLHSAGDLSVSPCVPMRWAIKAALDDVTELARQRDVRLSIDEINGTFFPKASRELGYMGLRFLLEGFVESLAEGDCLRVSSGVHDAHQTRMIVSLSKHYIRATQEFFVPWGGDHLISPASSVSFRIAAAMLGLSVTDISLSASVSDQLISIDFC